MFLTGVPVGGELFAWVGYVAEMDHEKRVSKTRCCPLTKNKCIRDRNKRRVGHRAWTKFEKGTPKKAE